MAGQDTLGFLSKIYFDQLLLHPCIFYLSKKKEKPNYSIGLNLLKEVLVTIYSQIENISKCCIRYIIRSIWKKF